MTMEAQITRVRPTYGFYRQPNGWITVSPAADMDELKYSRKGWTRLNQYGRIEMSAEYAADHPFESLFMQGGAKEFCREQIIESGMHLNPPLIPACGMSLGQDHSRHRSTCMDTARPVVFPQITAEDLVSYPCRFCNRPALPTEAARDQHEGVMHKEEKGEIRSGEAIAAAMIKGLAPQPAAPVAVAEAPLGNEPPIDPFAAFAAAGVKLLPWQLKKLSEAGVPVPAGETND